MSLLYDYWFRYTRFRSHEVHGVTVTVEVPSTETEPDAEDKIVRELANLLGCPEEAIGRKGTRTAAPIDVDLLRVVFELAMDMAVRKAVGVAKYIRPRSPSGATPPDSPASNG